MIVRRFFHVTQTVGGFHNLETKFDASSCKHVSLQSKNILWESKDIATTSLRSRLHLNIKRLKVK
jgi:hypothetical protein